jgi:hypothetical protein
MKKLKRVDCLVTGLSMLLASGLANAASINVNQGQTVDNNSWLNINGTSKIHGILNNYDRIDISANTYISGVVNNHGFMDIMFLAFSILADNAPQSAPYDGNNRKIINHSDGTIMMNGFIDMYSDHAFLENAGRFIVTRQAVMGLTAGMMSGTIKNTGFMQLEGRQNTNACPNSGELKFVNEGYLEISDQTLCDFDEYSWSSLNTTFTQNGGETRVNGTFGAHTIYVNKGLISGNGNVTGSFGGFPLFDAVTLSPGAPIGILTLTPKDGYLMCVRCSIDIELAGANQADSVHVNGEFDMNGWNLNVLLRDGYIPAPGTQFTVVSANPVVYYGPAPKYNLPALPNGRTWDVQNIGTEVILTAN